MERGCRMCSLFSFSTISFQRIFFMFTSSELLDKLNAHLVDLKFSRSAEGLYAPVSYVLSLGGKRIRAVLMLLA